MGSQVSGLSMATTAIGETEGAVKPKAGLAKVEKAVKRARGKVKNIAAKVTKAVGKRVKKVAGPLTFKDHIINVGDFVLRKYQDGQKKVDIWLKVKKLNGRLVHGTVANKKTAGFEHGSEHRIGASYISDYRPSSKPPKVDE